MTADQGGRQRGALPWRPGDCAGIPAVRVWTADRPESGGSSSGLPGTGEHGGRRGARPGHSHHFPVFRETGLSQFLVASHVR